jgi:peptidoglycan/xylan/chitin deacetylase (PgdA/CDA1 family)
MVIKIFLALIVLLLFTSVMLTGLVTAQGPILNASPECQCKCVAFRLDDIQDYFLNKVQIEIINLFRETNSSLTLGIIANSFGQDDHLVKTIQEAIGNNNNGSQIEIANHGWNHEDFTQFSKKVQADLIKQANQKIKSTLITKMPTGFIPPFNLYNNDTISALQINNMEYISSNLSLHDLKLPSEDKLFSSDNVQNKQIGDNSTNHKEQTAIYNFPFTAETGAFSFNGSYGIDYEQTLKQVNESLNKYGFAVVLMHPQQYSKVKGLEYDNTVDLNQINQLNLLLQRLKGEGLKIVSLGDLNRC